MYSGKVKILILCIFYLKSAYFDSVTSRLGEGVRLALEAEAHPVVRCEAVAEALDPVALDPVLEVFPVQRRLGRQHNAFDEVGQSVARRLTALLHPR